MFVPANQINRPHAPQYSLLPAVAPAAPQNPMLNLLSGVAWSVTIVAGAFQIADYVEKQNRRSSRCRK